jgi:exopolyphosphatase/guanosine-5'-triphosphate,3'-diphosphate pyrophosphatase
VDADGIGGDDPVSDIEHADIVPGDRARSLVAVTDGAERFARESVHAGPVPRWEWRAFGEDLAAARRTLAQLTPNRVDDSDEVYVLAAPSDESVKVRDGVMDVKHLEAVDEKGLELWRPILKAQVPLSRADVRAVLDALGIAHPPLARLTYTMHDFEAEIVQPNPSLLAVAVHKRRAHYVIDKCMVESTDLRAGHVATHTIAIESPDPDLVMATIRRLGLSGLKNTCVARGLKALVGFGGRRAAVIDVGTNSVKFHVGERGADGVIRTVVDRAEMTRLGQDLGESGRLSDSAMARTIDAIAAMVDEANERNAEFVVAVGTAGLRQAPNRAAFLDSVRRRTGLDVEVISGEDEARFAYVAATSTLPAARGHLVVFDSGGGSTQFTFGEPNRIDERFSLDIGAVRVSERHRLDGAVSADELDAAMTAVSRELARLDGRPRPDAIIGIGGTATNLAAVKHSLSTYDADIVHGTVLDLAEIDRQIELYRTRNAEQRRHIAGLQPARAEVILAGACIVRSILTKLHLDSLTVSDRGLRHGVFASRFA